MLRKLLILLAAIAVCASAHAQRKDNNPYGMMLMTDGDANTAGQLYQMQLARDFCGEWGYVRIGAGVVDEGVEPLVRTVVSCRAMHLIPVLTALRLSDEYYDSEQPDEPIRDPDGSLTTFGKAYEDWLRKVYARGITIPYFEYGNEVNAGYYGKHPEVYAEMCIEVSKAFKRVDPNMSFGTAGMAGSGHDFYDAMLTKVPELIHHVDHWGMHPYSVNHPPGYCQTLGDYGIDSHVWTARVLEKHGVKNPIFLMTETGYELGNEVDRRFPKITEELRAEYLVEAYKKYWEPDPRVLGVMPFMIQDTRWSGWNGWDFIREDYTMTPMYVAIRDLPKPKGSDYMPTGPCTIKGRILESELGRGVGGYLIWVRRPGLGSYAAVTDAQGNYEIANIPEGEYDISGYCDGFTSTDLEKLVLKQGKPLNWDRSVSRVGWLTQLDGDPTDPIVLGWTSDSDADVYSLDADVKRTGTASQRIEASGSPEGIWQVSDYETCLPDRVYSAEVWVKTKGLVKGDGQGVTLSLKVTDSFNRPLADATVKLSSEGDVEWTPLTVAIRSVPKGRRFRVTLGVDAREGQVWFDDVYLHSGDWPLPSALDTKGIPSRASISGAVLGPDGRQRLGKATVCTVPMGRWAVTDHLGQYRIENLPPGDYQVFAFHPEYQSAAPQSVRAGRARISGVDITLGEIPAAAELVDPGFEIIPKIPTWFTGWNRFGTTEGVVPAGWHKDLGLKAFPDGFQPRTGDGFFGVVAGSNIKDGGIYQTIEVEPNALYEVSVWSQTYQTDDGIRGDVANRLGVDPLGGNDPESPYVIWTPFRPSHGEWTQIKLRVRPVKPKMTIYLHHLQVHGLYFNCNFFDDVEVKKIGPPADGMYEPDI